MRREQDAKGVGTTVAAAAASRRAGRPLSAGALAAPVDGDDDRVLRRALAAACAAHLALLALSLSPRPREPVQPPRQREVFRVEPIRVRQTPPPPLEVPAVRTLRVPIPAPTPDDPEPLRPPELEVPRWSAAEVAADLFTVPPPPPPLADDEPLPVGGDVLPPVKQYAPSPPYPEAARRAGLQGVVIVAAVVDATGAVRDVRVLRGPPILDRAAAAAVSGWRFAPATRAGRPVAVRYNLTVTFTLAR